MRQTYETINGFKSDSFYLKLWTHLERFPWDVSEECDLPKPGGVVGWLTLIPNNPNNPSCPDVLLARWWSFRGWTLWSQRSFQPKWSWFIPDHKEFGDINIKRPPKYSHTWKSPPTNRILIELMAPGTVWASSYTENFIFSWFWTTTLMLLRSICMFAITQLQFSSIPSNKAWHFSTLR